MVEMDKSHLIEQLKQFCRQLSTFSSYRDRAKNKEKLSPVEEKEFFQLFESVPIAIGAYQPVIEKLVKVDDFYVNGIKSDVWAYAIRFRDDPNTSEAMSRCVMTVLRAIGGLQNLSESEILQLLPVTHYRHPTVFIAHEGMTKSLQKLKEFLEALGINYSIAEIEPSDGRSVEKQVSWAKDKADCAIILATKGKAINKRTNKSYMGMNVADELGRAREIFQNRIILLLQEGVEPHTNISEIVRQSFTPRNMEQAFIKIAKEFRNWGFIFVGEQEKVA